MWKLEENAALHSTLRLYDNSVLSKKDGSYEEVGCQELVDAFNDDMMTVSTPVKESAHDHPIFNIQQLYNNSQSLLSFRSAI